MIINKQINLRKTIILCSNSVFKNNINYFNNLKKKLIFFLPINSKVPDYIYLLKKYKKIKNKKFTNLLIIGGGKTIDSGKVIINFFNNKDINLIILPTLLGSGAEITNSAVFFKNKIKSTICSNEVKTKKIIYSQKLFNQASNDLRVYAALDCLCQSVESIWSKKANRKSIKYASLSFINAISYLKLTQEKRNSKLAFNKLCYASLNVGKAMNITRTTAPHALSYALTAHLNINHGLAVSIIFKQLFYKNMKGANLMNRKVILKLFKVKEINQAYLEYRNLLKHNGINLSINLSSKKIEMFLKEINKERLSNNPINLDKDFLKYIYSQI